MNYYYLGNTICYELLILIYHYYYEWLRDNKPKWRDDKVFRCFGGDITNQYHKKL